MLIFFFVGLMSLIIKSNRAVYVILGIEIMIMGVFISLIVTVREGLFIIILSFSLFSRVLGLVTLITLISTFGRDYVKY